MFYDRISNKALFIRGLFFFTVIIFFANSIADLISRWLDTEGYYTQGPFVAIAFAWILTKKQKNSINVYKPSRAGYIITAAALLLRLAAQYTSIMTPQLFSLYLFIIGCSCLFFGSGFLKKNIMLYIYLLLALPLPNFFLDYITFNLKMISVHISEFLLLFIYPSTIRLGNILYIDKYYIEITPACSGMENLFGMLSLLWFFALIQKRRIISIIDYVISIPAAILSNIIRILIVSTLTVNGYGKFALHDYHELIGISVFIIIFFVIILFNDLPDLKKQVIIKNNSLASINQENKILIHLIIIMGVFIAGSLSITLHHEQIKKISFRYIKNLVLPETTGWKSRDMEIPDSYYPTLGTNDILMREYTKKTEPGQGSIYLYLLHNSGSRSSFMHRPELCLTGEGYNLVKWNELKLHSGNITVSRQLFKRGSKGLLVYYWYHMNGINLNNYADLQLKMFTTMESNLDCSMIRLSRIVDPDNVEKGEILLRDFAENEIPLILKKI